MKRIYLVRHGETTHNEAGLVQDGTTELSTQGQQQAVVVAERLATVAFDHLVVSDYVRTRQTAEPLLALKSLTPLYSPLFREVRRPSRFFHQSRKSAEYRAFLDAELDRLMTDPNGHDSDEENFVDVVTRAKAALEYLLTLDGDVAVISHGHFIRYVVALVAMQLKLEASHWYHMCVSFEAVNTGITNLTYDADRARWQILTFNDIAHFAE